MGQMKSGSLDMYTSHHEIAMWYWMSNREAVWKPDYADYMMSWTISRSKGVELSSEMTFSMLVRAEFAAFSFLKPIYVSGGVCASSCWWYIFQFRAHKYRYICFSLELMVVRGASPLGFGLALQLSGYTEYLLLVAFVAYARKRVDLQVSIRRRPKIRRCGRVIKEVAWSLCRKTG